MKNFIKDISEIILVKDTNDKLWQLLRLLQRFPDLIESYFKNELKDNNENVIIEVRQELKNKFQDLSFLLGKVLEAELKPQLNKEIESIKNQITAELEKVRQMKLIAGKDGTTPIKGKDYFTKQEIREFLNLVKPVKGKDYFDGEKGQDGKNIDENKIIKQILSLIPQPKNGEDGSPDTAKEIIEKINSSEYLIDASKIKNLPRVMNLGGRGGSGAGAESVEITPSGIINGVNTIFTLPSTPRTGAVKLFVNGMRMKSGGEDYSISGITITMVSAPPTDSKIICDYETA